MFRRAKFSHTRYCCDNNEHKLPAFSSLVIQPARAKRNIEECVEVTFEHVQRSFYKLRKASGNKLFKVLCIEGFMQLYLFTNCQIYHFSK